MDDIDQQRMASGGVDERLREAPRQKAAPEGVGRFAQSRADQEDPEPWKQGEIVERREQRAVDPERQKPIEADGHLFVQDPERHPHPKDERAPGGAGDRPGLFEGRAIEQDRDRQALEDPKIDGRGRIEEIGRRSDRERHGQKPQAPAQVAPAHRAADAREDDEEPGEEILSHRPGDAGEVGRKAEEPFHAAEFAQIEKKMVADHQDDGQTAQEIDLPDALSAVRLAHGERILRAALRRQGTAFDHHDGADHVVFQGTVLFDLNSTPVHFS